MGEPIRIVRAVQTAMMLPTQWDLWDTDDNYYYARFEEGHGTLRQYQDDDWVGAPWKKVDETQPGWGITANTKFICTVATFDTDEWDMFIPLQDFAALSGIELDPQVYEAGFGDHVRDELIKDGMMLFLESG